MRVIPLVATLLHWSWCTASPTVDDAKYVAKFEELQSLLAQKNVHALKQSCSGADHAVQLACSLLIYLGEHKQDAKSFVSHSPHTKEQAEWLWRWDAILLRHLADKTQGLFPSGFAGRYIDEIALLVNFGEPALDELLTLDGYADGVYAEYIADKLILILRDQPEIVYNNWLNIRSHATSLQGALELYPEDTPFVKRSFDRLCAQDRRAPKCKEIENLFPTQAQ